MSWPWLNHDRRTVTAWDEGDPAASTAFLGPWERRRADDRWTSDELDRIEAADELEIASRRTDGRLRPPVTIWDIRFGGDLYARSVNGRHGAWFRGTQDRHEGWVSAGGLEKDVTFVDAGGGIDDEIDSAYRTKYRRYGPNIVGSIVTAEARSATIKLLP